MLTYLSQFLYRYSNVWTALAATALYAGFIATVMPQQAEDSRAYAGEWGAPDGHFFYTPDKLYAEIGTWTPAGRDDYINFRLGLDIVWALAYTAFLITLISCCLSFALAVDTKQRLLNTFPFITLVCDYAENAIGIVLVANYATRLDLLAWLGALLTSAKWVSLLLAHCILVYAIVRAVHKHFSGRRPQG